MCGIVGVCGKVTTKEENVFKTLLCLDTVRGPDSTGVLGVSGSTGFEIFKKVGTPWDCFNEKDFAKIFKFTNVLLLGHNRAATVGHVIDENAHPFDVGDIIGVHNGTLRNESKLDDYQKFSVDSETMLHNFAKNGVAETVKIIDGAFACVFYDKRDHSVHFLRNNDRPLTWAFSEDRKTLFWASEAWMLSVACGRCGAEIEQITDMTMMREYSLALPTKSSPSAVDELPDFLFKDLYKYEPPPPPTVPWRPKTVQSKPKVETKPPTKMDMAAERRRKMCSFVNKDVPFSVSGFVDGKHQKFVRAYAELPDAEVVEIRIFMSQKDKRFEDMVMGKDKLWQGHVKRVNTLDAQKGYLLLDNRTIKPFSGRTVPGDIKWDEKCFNLFRNKPVTCQEWLDATAAGCDNCGHIPLIRQADQLEWYDNDKFFCKPCYATASVQQYLSVLPED